MIMKSQKFQVTMLVVTDTDIMIRLYMGNHGHHGIQQQLDFTMYQMRHQCHGILDTKTLTTTEMQQVQCTHSLRCMHTTQKQQQH